MEYASTDERLSQLDFENDIKLVEKCNNYRTKLSQAPVQSNFKVYCLLIFQTSTINNDKYLIIHGTNSEPSYIGGSICAERSAIVKLRFYDDAVIKKVIVTTDSSNTISPGSLCREYLTSFAISTTPIIMGNVMTGMTLPL